MFNTLAEIKAANAAQGQHFFCSDAIRFFSSRVSNRIYPRADGGAYFVTSERYRGSPRLYTVREADPTGRCQTAPFTKFQDFKTAKAAHAWVAEFCKATVC